FDGPWTRMLSLSSRTCMPRSGARTAPGLLRGTRERPPRMMSWSDAAPQTAEQSPARLDCQHRLVARCKSDFARQLAIGVSRRATGLVLEDGTSGFGRFFVGIVRGDFCLEYRHVALEAVPHRRDDALGVGLLEIDHGQEHAENG